MERAYRDAGAWERACRDAEASEHATSLQNKSETSVAEFVENLEKVTTYYYICSNPAAYNM